MDDLSQRGVTLLELLVTLALLMVILTLGVPSVSHWLDRQRLKSTAESLITELRQIRTEAVMQPGNQPLYVHFQTGTDWCLGAASNTQCDCQAAPGQAQQQCRYRRNGIWQQRIHTALHHGIELVEARFSRGRMTRFDPLRGLASAGRLTLENRHQDQLQVRLSPLGRMRLCTPNGSAISGYVSC